MNTRSTSLSQFNKGLLWVLLVSILLYLGKPFLIPIAIAAFFAMLLYPMVLKMYQRYGIKEPVAAFLSILLLLALLIVIGTIIYYQLRSLEADLPRIETKIDEKTNLLQWQLYQKTDITAYEQDEIIEEKKPDIAKAIFKSVRDAVLQGLFVIVFVFIVLTYTFFFMVYQQRIQNFFIQLRLFDSQKESKVMLARVSRIIHDYLKGTLSVISLLAVLYAVGFWAIGIEHAILFAVITALLRIIPYFGSFLGIAFPVAYALLTKDSFWYPTAVLLFFMATQLLEANVLTPYITGSRVKLNPLATILLILLGNLIWGIPGMILFVPLFASLKIFFDRIPHLSAYGYILGNNDVPPEKEQG